MTKHLHDADPWTAAWADQLWADDCPCVRPTLEPPLPCWGEVRQLILHAHTQLLSELDALVTAAERPQVAAKHVCTSTWKSDDAAAADMCQNGNGNGSSSFQRKPSPSEGSLVSFFDEQAKDTDSPARPAQAGSRRSTRKKSVIRSVEEKKESGLKGVVSGYAFELAFAMLICLNTITMCLEVQYKGLEWGYRLGQHGYNTPADESWPVARMLFSILEMVFGISFTIEVVLKMIALRTGFVTSGWNWFDSVIILFWVIDQLASMDVFMNPMFLRLARLARLLR
eukprot:TRINITY_DN53306_c0_g1_i1.p1 TRINITY_DN53306_c0_g1~~TRINITY_DN53306_c0_g1_i1.p1  ORF type:complete len:283 (-),score=45.33 TRINITY_DN53306_c0_g1_i1:201-1049(-)